MNRRQQTCVVFRHNDFPKKDLHAVERFCQIITKGPASEFFSDEIDEMIKDVIMEEKVVVEAEENNIEEAATYSIDRFRAGGEVDAVNVTEADHVVEDDNLPLAENVIKQEPDDTTAKCQ